MVHYDPECYFLQPPAPICPVCGSHRTSVIGRIDDGRTLILKCEACGAHSSVILLDDDPATSAPEEAAAQMLFL